MIGWDLGSEHATSTCRSRYIDQTPKKANDLWLSMSEWQDVFHPSFCKLMEKCVLYSGKFSREKTKFWGYLQKFSPQNLGVWQYFVAPASILQKIFHKINNFAMIWKIWSKIGIPLVARQTYDNAFGLSIMIFTASSKITSLPKDINRLHLAASSALKFAYTTSKGATGSNIPI